MERGTIEVAPLAFMRGRTLNDSFVILDEAQNTTTEQMKMFLTRLGFDSQGGGHRRRHPDRPAERARSAASLEARKVLRGRRGHRASARFTEVDVVRHPLVQEVVKAYEGYEARLPPKGGGP